MKSDTYTKFILTVIAVALIGLLLKEAPPIVTKAHAAGESTALAVNIAEIGGKSFKSQETFLGDVALPVKSIEKR
jgi:hypothetical protein